MIHPMNRYLTFGKSLGIGKSILYGYYCLAAITSSYRLLAQVFYTTIRDLVNMMSYLKPRYLFKPLASLMLF